MKHEKFEFFLNGIEELEKFVDQFKGMNHHDFLMQCFENDSNPYGSSDIIPYKLVCTFGYISFMIKDMDVKNSRVDLGKFSDVYKKS